MRKLLSLAVLFTPVLHAAPVVDWPSYNRTVTSERFSPLAQITPANASKMKVVCTYDTGESTAFQSGLVQVDGALFATTEHDTFSINPDTCAVNWRVHEDFTSSYLGAQRGVAIENGRVFRGSSSGDIFAYDQKTGKTLWKTNIGDQPKGETVPASPIVWNGMVFIGNAGGRIERVHAPFYSAVVATGVADEDHSVPCDGRRRDRFTLWLVTDVGFPRRLAGLLIVGKDIAARR
ncbi:MAG: hypothetical protein EOO79_08525, partial [Oxalobacteraceae bacterium]